MLASTTGSASGRVRGDARGQVDRQRLGRPLDAVPGGHALRRRQADPPPPEALHDERAGADGEVDGRRLVLAGAVEADQALAAADDAGDERRAAVGQAAGDGERDVGDVDDLERPGRLAAHRVRRGRAGRRSGARRPRGRAGAGRSPARRAAAPAGRRRRAARCPRRRARCAAAACGARGRRARAASSSRPPACPTTARDRIARRPHSLSAIRSTFPVTSRAASLHSQAITAATSAGSATWWCSGDAATNARTSSVTQPVSVTGGCTTLAVMPNGASSVERRHRVVLERRLGRAVGDLLREARSGRPTSARRCVPTSRRGRCGGGPARRSAGPPARASTPRLRSIGRRRHGRERARRGGRSAPARTCRPASRWRC